MGNKKRLAPSRLKNYRIGRKRAIGSYRFKRRPVGQVRKSLAWAGSPFPREMWTTLTYTENIVMTSTTGAPSTYLFSTNGLYDCNISGTGNQPRYFDTLCGSNNTTAVYNNYKVHASKIDIQVIATGSDSTACRGFIGIGLYNTTASAPSSLAELRVRPDFKTKFLGYWSGGHDLVKMKRFTTTKHLFGIKDIADSEDLQGDKSANPSKDARWAICYVPFDETSTRTVSVLVRIKYFVQFYDMNDVADS